MPWQSQGAASSSPARHGVLPACPPQAQSRCIFSGPPDRREDYLHFAEVGHDFRETAKDAQRLRDRAEGHTQARLAPKQVREYQALLLFEAW